MPLPRLISYDNILKHSRSDVNLSTAYVLICLLLALNYILVLLFLYFRRKSPKDHEEDPVRYRDTEIFIFIH